VNADSSAVTRWRHFTYTKWCVVTSIICIHVLLFFYFFIYCFYFMCIHFLIPIAEMILQTKAEMMGTSTKSASMRTEKNSIGRQCKAPVTCCPTVYKFSKAGCRQRKQPNRRQDRVEKISWCGFRSLVSSVSARLTAGISNRRGNLTSSNDAWVLSSSLSKTIHLPKGLARESRNAACTTEAEEPKTSVEGSSLNAIESGRDTPVPTTCIGKSEDEDDRTKEVEDDGCRGQWWWDTAWYDLTNVTPADMSAFSNKFNSWLTSSTLSDNDSSYTNKMKLDTDSCSSSSAAQHVTSRDEDEMAKENKGKDEREDKTDDTAVHWYHSALKMALLRAASHGHRDVVCDILRQTSRARQVAAVDVELRDLVNCVDSQVCA